MRVIAVLAVGICIMSITGNLESGPVIFGQSFTVIASLIACSGLAYVLGRN